MVERRFMAERQSPNQGMQSDRNESKGCFYCGRLGHMVKDCHKKKSDGLGINLEHIQVIMQKNLQIKITNYLLLVMILMYP